MRGLQQEVPGREVEHGGDHQAHGKSQDLVGVCGGLNVAQIEPGEE